jgi:hypothetical protein
VGSLADVGGRTSVKEKVLSVQPSVGCAPAPAEGGTLVGKQKVRHSEKKRCTQREAGSYFPTAP